MLPDVKDLSIYLYIYIYIYKGLGFRVAYIYIYVDISVYIYIYTYTYGYIWGYLGCRVPPMRVPFWGIPFTRITVFWGLYWGVSYLWKLPCKDMHGVYRVFIRFAGFHLRYSP